MQSLEEHMILKEMAAGFLNMVYRRWLRHEPWLQGNQPFGPSSPPEHSSARHLSNSRRPPRSPQARTSWLHPDGRWRQVMKAQNKTRLFKQQCGAKSLLEDSSSTWHSSSTPSSISGPRLHLRQPWCRDWSRATHGKPRPLLSKSLCTPWPNEPKTFSSPKAAAPARCSARSLRSCWQNWCSALALGQQGASPTKDACASACGSADSGQRPRRGTTLSSQWRALPWEP